MICDCPISRYGVNKMNNKIVDHNFKVYVGDNPATVVKLYLRYMPPQNVNPKTFFEHAVEQNCDAYSNNMCYVRYFKPENVIVCRIADGKMYSKSLTECPKFEKWKDEMDSGELFSLFGNEWV